jgi:TM2 domain-containing membrane protein YozV
MRTALSVSLFLVLFAAAAGAQQKDSPSAALNEEITAIIDQNAATPLGTMTIADFEKIAGQVSVAIQKRQYVARARAASLMLPGAGQFMTGDPVGGTLFVAGDLGILVGTLLGGYFLLPQNVQFGSLDYLGTPFSAIRATWQSNTALQYLPSAGVIAGGAILEGFLRWFAGAHAANEARENISSGKVTFQPMLLPMMGPGGMMGMGIMLGFRY